MQGARCYPPPFLAELAGPRAVSSPLPAACAHGSAHPPLQRPGRRGCLVQFGPLVWGLTSGRGTQRWAIKRLDWGRSRQPLLGKGAPWWDRARGSRLRPEPGGPENTTLRPRAHSHPLRRVSWVRGTLRPLVANRIRGHLQVGFRCYHALFFLINSFLL